MFIKKYTKVFVMFNYVDSDGIVRESKKLSMSRKESEVTGGSWRIHRIAVFDTLGRSFHSDIQRTT